MAPIAIAKKLFYNNPGAVRLREMIEPDYHEKLGHGIFPLHSRQHRLRRPHPYRNRMSDRLKPVALERLMLIGIYAGLLHDICRDEAKPRRVRGQESRKDTGRL